jgi:hydrogenase-4 component E
MTPDKVAWIREVSLLDAGCFLLCSFGLIAAAQVLGCMRIYVIQSLLLTIDCVLLALDYHSWDLLAVAAIYLIAKVLLIPFLLRRTARQAMIARRELQQVINVPMSLLIALALTVLAYYLVGPMLVHTGVIIHVNLPIGFASVLIAVYTITVRREALPQMLGLLAIENGAFFAGIAVAPTFPLVGELAAAFDILIIVMILGVLSTQIHHLSGSTEVGMLSELTED